MTLTYCETNVSCVLATGVNLCFPSAYPTHTPHLKPLACPSNVLSRLSLEGLRDYRLVCVFLLLCISVCGATVWMSDNVWVCVWHMTRPHTMICYWFPFLFLVRLVTDVYISYVCVWVEGYNHWYLWTLHYVGGKKNTEEKNTQLKLVLQYCLVWKLYEGFPYTLLQRNVQQFPSQTNNQPYSVGDLEGNMRTQGQRKTTFCNTGPHCL